MDLRGWQAECGGARHLLPILAEQLCSERSTPSHLKAGRVASSAFLRCGSRFADLVQDAA